MSQHQKRWVKVIYIIVTAIVAFGMVALGFF